MKKKPSDATINVRGTEITVIRQQDEDYISLTDIAKSRNPEHPDDLIRNWLRNRNTLELLGIWEQLHNPGFNPVEFNGIKKQAGLNSFTLFGQTAREWRDGNMRDQASLEQLLVLANLENMNAEFIHMGLPQGDRLKRLNQIAIRQMQTLTARTAERLEGSGS